MKYGDGTEILSESVHADFYGGQNCIPRSGSYTIYYYVRSKLSLCIWHREITLWFALLTATPIILHTLFLSRHWWTIEGKQDGNRLLTFPLLIFQIWPQYQLLKLLYNNEWAKEKLNYDKKIGSLGNFKIYLFYFHNYYVRKIESVGTFVIASFNVCCPLRGPLRF